MKNQKYTNGDHIAVTAPKDYVGGQPARIGTLTGVVVKDVKSGGRVTLWRDGSYDIPVAGAATVGAAVYIKSDDTLTTTATGNFLFGSALGSKTAATAPLEVLVVGAINPTASA